jgi:hypothetical protein
VDGELWSDNRWLRLVLQGDGNLVLYRVQAQQALWATGTDGQPVDHVAMQADGNLVAYSSDGTARWASNTAGNPGASLDLQDDGNLVIYDTGRRPLWASNTVQDFLTPVIHVNDGTYSYVETSESWKKLCEAFPCFLALQWPGYATTIVDTQINGEDVVLQLWKGYCPKFLGHASFPGGIGSEVGVYRRIPGKFRPTSLPFLPGPLATIVGNALSSLNDDDLWWPAPELNASVEMRMVNPVTGETFLTSGPQTGYWLTRWMDEFDYLRYATSHHAPAVFDFTAYVLEYSINGQAFEPWTNQGPTRQHGTGAHGEINAVVRSSDHLDVFVTDTSGVTRTGAWEPAFSDGWHGWWEIRGGRAGPGAPITAVSRNVDKLDVFAVGTDGHAYTAAWEPAFADGWHGWWRVGDISLPQGSRIGAVSRSPDKLDVFATDTAGVVRTAAWEPAFADGWHGWWEIRGGRAAPGATVTAVSRNVDKLDVFVVGTDGGIWTAAWEPAFTDGWHGWWRIGNITAPPGAAIHAVSRSTDKLDIFVTANDGGIYTAAWEPLFTDGWHGWWRVGSITAPPGAPVHAVSRSRDHLDIFVSDIAGVVQTAAWEPAFTDGWHGWWELNGGRATPGAAVTVASRSLDKLDVFVAGTDHGLYTAAWEPAFTGWHGWWRIGP